MSTERIIAWSQLAATLAVLVGLVLVIYELRETRVLTSATMASETYNQVIGGNLAILGEDAAESIAKACLGPKSLEPRDLVVLDAYFDSLYQQASRIRGVSIEGEFNLDLRLRLTGYFETIAETEIGIAYLQSRLVGMDPSDVRAVIMKEVLGRQDGGCSHRLLHLSTGT